MGRAGFEGTPIIDSREKLPYDFKGGVVRKLDTGDYSLEGYEHLLTVDRKASVSELATNLTQKRFTAELERMSHIKHSYLLLEFSVDDILRYPQGSDIPRRRWRYIKVRASLILSILARIGLQYGVQVIYAGDRDNAQKILTNIFRQFEKIYGKENGKDDQK